ncbi:hypothetical protein Cni_G07023 [Canna indica]|uniref:non-specific serine/threonine protein kinase n=1 Tax=Canna indica TaxID=4628 RepID=A0AAQ3JY46_9LILI|nr:hypothetical protein Cni_G07023 [Canna indica]
MPALFSLLTATNRRLICLISSFWVCFICLSKKLFLAIPTSSLVLHHLPPSPSPCHLNPSSLSTSSPSPPSTASTALPTTASPARSGAMADTAMPWPLQFLLLLFFLAAWQDTVAAGVPQRDIDILLKFKESLSASVIGADAALHNWVPGSNPCRANITLWAGVICNLDSSVRGVQLENMSLSGPLNVDALVGMPTLRTMSFMNNSFQGPIPDVSKFPALRSIYMSMNRFSGEVPDGMFAGMAWLKKVHLSRNDFTGRIPSSLVNATRLLELRLDDNKFQGPIPEFRQPGLYLFNVSDNRLEGPIPIRLRKMSAKWFAGNDNLCGAPLSVACGFPKKYSRALTAAIIMICIAILLIIIGLILIFYRRRKEQAQPSRLPSSKSMEINQVQADKIPPAAAVVGATSKKLPKDEQGKLIFVKEGMVKFDIQDLLRASAEVLGSGSFGSSYKAILTDGPSVVVKRFKEMNGVGREDFHEHMRRIGRLCHPNLLPLVAYYYRKEEKLLVTEYMFNGSLAHMLHGNHGANVPPLDWPTRLKIIKGIARGLSFLYEELPVLNLPHGHLKSSNVLLNYSFDPILSDYALVPVMNKTHAAQIMVAFKSPECTMHSGKPTKKSDVWCFGILILEILTGKFPANYLRQGQVGTDLASWVNSVVREEWTGEVFDSNMKGTQGGEGEMLKLLHIGLACSEADVDKRCELAEAVAKIEELKEYDDGSTLVLSS